MSDKSNSSLGDKFQNLVNIMAQLRGQDGCPWDKEQTHESLRQYLLEETYEVLESIDKGHAKELKEELGDLLLQIIFHGQIASERKVFDIETIIDALSEKLIRRHPNVFGDTEINSAEEQSINWEKIKKQEGKNSVLDGVPKTFSALLRAWRIQQKASTVGFDWPVEEPVWSKVYEEINELKEAAQNKNSRQMEEEFGDLIFSLVNLSRFIGINPEDALRITTEKFITRFQKIESELASKNREMRNTSLEELDALWEGIKSKENITS